MSGVKRGAPVEGLVDTDTSGRADVVGDGKGSLADSELADSSFAMSPMGTTRAPAPSVEITAAVGTAALIEDVVCATRGPSITFSTAREAPTVTMNVVVVAVEVGAAQRWEWTADPLTKGPEDESRS